MMVTVRAKSIFCQTLRLLLVSALALSGCAKEEADGHEKKAQGTPSSSAHKEVGKASWYGPGFHGRETASGGIFNQGKMTAAHPSLPLGTEVEVTNLENKKKVEVEITDRGPYAKDRIIDLSKAAAKKLDMAEEGVGKVKIEASKPVKKKNQSSKSSTKANKKRIKTANAKVKKPAKKKTLSSS